MATSQTAGCSSTAAARPDAAPPERHVTRVVMQPPARAGSPATPPAPPRRTALARLNDACNKRLHNALPALAPCARTCCQAGLRCRGRTLQALQHCWLATSTSGQLVCTPRCTAWSTSCFQAPSKCTPCAARPPGRARAGGVRPCRWTAALITRLWPTAPPAASNVYAAV